MNPKSPGVYVLEESSGVKPIEGAGTATGAFVGLAPTGAELEPKLITTWTDYQKVFGTPVTNEDGDIIGYDPYAEAGFLPYSVRNFFDEGGSKCYVVRVASESSNAVSEDLLDANGEATLRVEAKYPGRFANNWKVKIEQAGDHSTDPSFFKLSVVTVDSADDETAVDAPYDNLSLSKYLPDGTTANPNYVETRINDASTMITIDDLESTTTSPGNRPANTTSGALYNMSGGEASMDDVNFEAGIDAFDTVDDINILAIPDKAGDREVILYALNYCKKRSDCFFIADPPMSLDPTAVLDFKNGTINTIFEGNAFNNSYGALYYPWLKVSDPSGMGKLIPPSGAAAGTYSNTDTKRGVHKAPAGTFDGYLDSAIGIERVVTSKHQENLNEAGINVIRTFPGTGMCVWGARTLTTDAEWKYINIRRLFIFLEETLLKSSQWVVFEPNDPKLWGSVKRNLTAFLTKVWRDGALFGSTADEAFFVKIDEENNPPAVRDLGQLIIEVGAAPVKPAEFVIIKIRQKTLTK